jgi:hypothetical protein
MKCPFDRSLRSGSSVGLSAKLEHSRVSIEQGVVNGVNMRGLLKERKRLTSSLFSTSNHLEIPGRLWTRVSEVLSTHKL